MAIADDIRVRQNYGEDGYQFEVLKPGDRRKVERAITININIDSVDQAIRDGEGRWSKAVSRHSFKGVN